MTSKKPVPTESMVEARMIPMSLLRIERLVRTFKTPPARRGEHDMAWAGNYLPGPTVICRGRGNAGYRGMAVGYPERVSLAFDTQEMNLRLIWRGEFATVNHGRF